MNAQINPAQASEAAQVFHLTCPEDFGAMPFVCKMPFFTHWRTDRQYLAAVVRNEVVGLICFTPESLWAPGHLGMAYTAVAATHRGQGIASKLVRKLLGLAKSQGKGVFVSNYEPDGKHYLRKVILRQAQALEVDVVEKSYMFETA